MAKGRRDYTWGVLQDSILPGRYSTNFFKFEYITLLSGTDGDVITYTVPAGYKLLLISVRVSTLSPATNVVRLTKNSILIIDLFYSLNYSFDFGSGGSYSFEAGDVLVVTCINYDTVAHTFYVGIMGVLEQLV